MRTSAFSTFRKLYGRILIDENTKLADKILEGNRTKLLNKIRNELYLKFNDTNIFGIEAIRKPLSKYRLSRGQYYVEIDYSNITFLICVYVYHSFKEKVKISKSNRFLFLRI